MNHSESHYGTLLVADRLFLISIYCQCKKNKCFFHFHSPCPHSYMSDQYSTILHCHTGSC